jgi:hypothetical protein
MGKSKKFSNSFCENFRKVTETGERSDEQNEMSNCFSHNQRRVVEEFLRIFSDYHDSAFMSVIERIYLSPAFPPESRNFACFPEMKPRKDRASVFCSGARNLRSDFHT